MCKSRGVKAHVCAPQDYLATESIDDLVSLLRKARLDTHLLDLFPPQKRTLKDLDEHFKVMSRASPHQKLLSLQAGLAADVLPWRGPPKAR